MNRKGPCQVAVASAALGRPWGPSPMYAQPEASPVRTTSTRPTAAAVLEGPVSRERLPRRLAGGLPGWADRLVGAAVAGAGPSLLPW